MVLAGGLATRLKPITNTIPKSLVNINGQPFIDWQLKLLRKKGFHRVILCLGKYSDQIIKFVGDGSKYNLEILYSEDGEILLGTGGALRNALKLINEDFFLTYGDSYLDINYSSVEEEFFKTSRAALMTVYKNTNKWEPSNAQVENDVVRTYSKRNYTKEMLFIDYGLSVIKTKSFEEYQRDGAWDLSEYFEYLSNSNNLQAYEVMEKFQEIGSINGINDLSEFLKGKDGFY